MFLRYRKTSVRRHTGGGTLAEKGKEGPFILNRTHIYVVSMFLHEQILLSWLKKKAPFHGPSQAAGQSPSSSMRHARSLRTQDTALVRHQPGVSLHLFSHTQLPCMPPKTASGFLCSSLPGMVFLPSVPHLSNCCSSVSTFWKLSLRAPAHSAFVLPPMTTVTASTQGEPPVGLCWGCAVRCVL